MSQSFEELTTFISWRMWPDSQLFGTSFPGGRISFPIKWVIGYEKWAFRLVRTSWFYCSCLKTSLNLSNSSTAEWKQAVGRSGWTDDHLKWRIWLKRGHPRANLKWEDVRSVNISDLTQCHLNYPSQMHILQLFKSFVSFRFSLYTLLITQDD